MLRRGPRQEMILHLRLCFQILVFEGESVHRDGGQGGLIQEAGIEAMELMLSVDVIRYRRDGKSPMGQWKNSALTTRQSSKSAESPLFMDSFSPPSCQVPMTST